MGKLLLSLVVLASLPLVAEARVEARFLGFVGVISLTDRVGGQKVDEDPQQLYRLMNVPPREENGQLGKSIVVGDKKLTMVCADRTSVGMLCTVVVKASNQGIVDSRYGRIRFVALSNEARQLHQLFTPGANGKVSFASADESFRLSSDGEIFLLEYTRP